MDSRSPSFPNQGSVWETWTEGSMDAGIPASSSGSPRFMAPTLTMGSGSVPASGTRCAAASAMARRATNRGLQANASSISSSRSRLSVTATSGRSRTCVSAAWRAARGGAPTSAARASPTPGREVMARERVMSRLGVFGRVPRNLPAGG